ncbi:MAG: peptide/nickel transport system permease protein [Propionibacteriaceae bacterium]|nr:yliD [Propionibacteriaceae bacterium]MDX6322668.1 peptide/nickel transport system permease protein [Propionibacteriaceae bacterium]
MRRVTLLAGVALVSVVVLLALVSFVWTPYDPVRVDPSARLLGPSAAHWLGTDGFGIDIASRIMVAAQTCLLVGVIAVGIAALVGVPIGIGSGLLGGWFSEVVMRVTDVLYAFPALLLAILLAAAFGASTWTAMIAIGIATIPAFARVARAGTVQVMASDYVLAARSCGTGRAAIAGRHILPNVAPVVGVQASVAFGIAILAEAALSYLGLATPPPTPTWGRMLRDAQTYLFTEPSLALWPGLAIAVAVLGFNLLGDGLRDLLDPKLREQAR